MTVLESRPAGAASLALSAPAVSAAEGRIAPVPAEPADVCLLVEGTYPFVSGGVSSWVHDIIRGQPDVRFAVLNVGSHPGAYGKPRYELPANVVGLHLVYCQDGKVAAPDGAARAELAEQVRAIRRAADARRGGSRVLDAFRRMHLADQVDDRMVDDLASADLPMAEFLHGSASFRLLAELAERLAPDAAFLDLFWHFRAIHAPLLRLLSAPIVPAACYHAVSTGYAGLVAAVWSHRTGRPLLVTEHGIYARERDMELARAEWIRDKQDHADMLAVAVPRLSPLRRLWSRFFRTLSRVAYRQATRIVTLSDVNRSKQIADGAPADKIDIVPNGVELQANAGAGELITRRPAGAPLRVGFVGRVVPIKDVITFVKSCDLALRAVELDVRVIGPIDEDPGYATRCRNLVELLGRQEAIKFLGPKPPAQIYPDLDVVVLTSFSEGQPLVILEAYAVGVPVIATDVGACREMIEGRTEEDRAMGPSGIVTRVATPRETAAGLVLLARDEELRVRMGEAGRRRVRAFYQRREMLTRYRELYRGCVEAP